MYVSWRHPACKFSTPQPQGIASCILAISDRTRIIDIQLFFSHSELADLDLKGNLNRKCKLYRPLFLITPFFEN